MVRYNTAISRVWAGSPNARRNSVGQAEKKSQPDAALSEKDQSIHIFEIPS
jgi:hypothetical protein